MTNKRTSQNDWLASLWKVVCACKHYFYLRSPDQLLVMINERFNERRLVPLATSLRKWHRRYPKILSQKSTVKKLSGLVSALTSAYSADAHHCPRYLSSPSESWWQFDVFFFLVNWYKLWGLYEVYEFMVIPLNQLGGLKVLLVFALAQVMPVIGYHRYDLRRVRLCEIRQSNASWFTLRARNVNGITQRVTFVLICMSIWNIGPSHDAI